jgi:N utilization substance protein B
MLNRRNLRIKLMQSIFAYEQCVEANYQLSLEFIQDRFQPDLMSMEVQDKGQLKKDTKEAIQLFEKKFKNLKTQEPSNTAINKAVDDALALFQKQVKKDYTFLLQNLVAGVEGLNHTYHAVLELLVEFAHVAKADKKLDHQNFINSTPVKALTDNPELKKEALKSEAWQNKMDKVRDWFRVVIKPDDVFQKFNKEESSNEETQRAIVKHIFRKLVLGPGPIHDFFEEQDIRWAEDADIIKSLVDKTMKSLDFESGTLTLQKLSLDWEDDKDFMNKMFYATVNLDASHKELIAKNTRNWEVDRLPLTDQVILEMAIAELLTFPNIPVKVTMNEYIELAKRYSTPNSRSFINGILDVISKDLKDSGAVRKSGRGLIDNK